MKVLEVVSLLALVVKVMLPVVVPPHVIVYGPYGVYGYHGLCSRLPQHGQRGGLQIGQQCEQLVSPQTCTSVVVVEQSQFILLPSLQGTS